MSVSRTPGHTKYFQTYYLTPTVKLCDCPGLVFPSRVNKQLQVQPHFGLSRNLIVWKSTLTHLWEDGIIDLTHFTHHLNAQFVGTMFIFL